MRNALTTPKMVVVMPMPSATQSNAMAVKPGLRRRLRSA
jgi:hypothetical protein